MNHAAVTPPDYRMASLTPPFKSVVVFFLCSRTRRVNIASRRTAPRLLSTLIPTRAGQRSDLEFLFFKYLKVFRCLSKITTCMHVLAHNKYFGDILPTSFFFHVEDVTSPPLDGANPHKKTKKKSLTNICPLCS